MFRQCIHNVLMLHLTSNLDACDLYWALDPLTASTQILWLENTILSYITRYSFLEKSFSIYSPQWNKWAFMQISRFYSAWRWQLLCNAHERCVIYWQVLNFKQFVSRGLKLSIFRVQVFPLSSMNFWAKQIDLNHLERVESSVWVGVGCRRLELASKVDQQF